MDVKAASDAEIKKSSQRIFSGVVPELEELGIEYKITKSERSTRSAGGAFTWSRRLSQAGSRRCVVSRIQQIEALRHFVYLCLNQRWRSKIRAFNFDSFA